MIDELLLLQLFFIEILKPMLPQLSDFKNSIESQKNLNQIKFKLQIKIEAKTPKGLKTTNFHWPFFAKSFWNPVYPTPLTKPDKTFLDPK